MLVPDDGEDIHGTSSDVFCTKTRWLFTVAASCGLAIMCCLVILKLHCYTSVTLKTHGVNS